MNLLIFCIFQLLVTLSVFGNDIAVLTLSVGVKYNEATHLGILSKSYYCKKHGYDFIVQSTSLDPKRPISWSKILQIKNVLKNYKWIFFTDADSLIMNYSIKLESFLDDQYNMIICKDGHSLNCGQFFLKNTPWSIQLLTETYNETEDIFNSLWEQEALRKVLKKNNSYFSKIKILPLRAFNSFRTSFFYDYPSNERGDIYFLENDFIVHFCGIRDLITLKTEMHSYALQSKSYPCNSDDDLSFVD